MENSIRLWLVKTGTKTAHEIIEKRKNSVLVSDHRWPRRGGQCVVTSEVLLDTSVRIYDVIPSDIERFDTIPVGEFLQGAYVGGPKTSIVVMQNAFDFIQNGKIELSAFTSSIHEAEIRNFVRMLDRIHYTESQKSFTDAQLELIARINAHLRFFETLSLP